MSAVLGTLERYSQANRNGDRAQGSLSVGAAFDRLRQLWYRHDSLFAENEESLDVESKRRVCGFVLFKTEKHIGGVGYLLVLNSMIFRVPLWLKRRYSPAVMRLEKMLAGFQSRTFSLAVICQWEKK